MKSIPLIASLLFFFCFSLKAEEQFRERVYVHTDKDCYIAGESILLKFYVINGNFQPSGLSKVGYVEFCDTKRPQTQLKVALEKGSGAGIIRIPIDLPTGIYQLSGYTRYMRNENDNVFFKKLIAIVNAGQQTPDPERYEPVEKLENIQLVREEQSDEKESANLLIYTDRNEYENRKKVILSLDNIPHNIADLVVSVIRNDTIALVPEINRREWLKQVKDTFNFSNQWLPEYEGHIISGHIIPELQEDQRFRSSIAFVGTDIRYFNGQINYASGTADFYIAGIFGKQQVVTSVVSPLYKKASHRLDLFSPFSESLPGVLPILQICPNEKRLTERYVAAQIQEKTDNDSLDNPVRNSAYSNLQPTLSYDLDKYTRFSTISETILEFVSRVSVTKIDGLRKIKVFPEGGLPSNIGTLLVLFDGIPVYDHEDILEYNPMYIKEINIYEGHYLFGGENFECIISFVTREGDLPFFQLAEGVQLFNYDCPQLPPTIKIQDYSIEEIRNSRKPDFRHTLYWNPFVEFINNQPTQLSFFTSDLCGEFKITVEGITTDGKIIRGVSYFQVKNSTP